MSKFRFYYSPGACSLATHIVLEETGAPYEMDLRSSREPGGTDSPAYRALNPKARVPALSAVAGKAGGVEGLLTESPAILVYLARRYPEAKLLPEELNGEVRALEWLSWLATDLHAVGYGALWRSRRFSSDPAQFPEIEAKARSNIRDRYDEIEAIFSDGREWSLPEGYSIIDPYLLVFWRWGTRIGLNMNLWPAWSLVMQRALARPAAQRALSGGHS